MVRITTVLLVITLSGMLLEINAWKDVAVGDYPFMALLHPIPNTARSGDKSPSLPHGAAIITPMFVYCVASKSNPLPSNMVPEVAWPYRVVAGIVNVSLSGNFNKTAQVREIALTKYYEKADSNSTMNYKWILIKVKEPFDFTKSEVSFTRIWGIVMKYLHKDFREPCQALHWEVRKDGQEVHLVGTQFYASGWQECESSEPAQYMSLCMSRFSFWWICNADPRQVFITCQSALAGVYDRFRSDSQTCKDVQYAKTLQDVKPARILTAWHDSGVMSSMMCEFPKESGEEDHVRFNLVDMASTKESRAQRQIYSFLLLCAEASSVMFTRCGGQV